MQCPEELDVRRQHRRVAHVEVADPARGIVFATTEDDRLVGGTQGIDLANGFTW